MQILSSLSGLQFSAASASYAPTNSGDVSAIASAYQVVSSTATQLYAGTAYLTSVNEAPISASRAGNAANASLANSAWYDGTGRLISALPDSATVSAIASSYAESAASSKQDTLTFGYNTADQISSINGSALGGMDEAAVSGIASAYAESAASSKLDTTAFNSGDFYTTANPSGFIDSAYVDSAVSGKADASALSGFYTTANESGFVDSSYVDSAVSSKQDKLTFGYDGANISSIDGSALAGGGAAFPAYIKSGDSALAEILTDFQANSYREPRLFISGSPSANIWPRVTVGQSRVTSFMSSCLEGGSLGIYSATASADPGTQVASYGVGAISSKGMYLNSAGFSASSFRLHKDVVSGSSWGIKKSGVSGVGWVYGSSEYNQLTSVYDTVSSNSASWTGGGGGGGGSYSAGNMISISSDVISFSSQANITDIKLVYAMPQSPESNVLYLIYESV